MSTRWQRIRESFELICDLDAATRQAKLLEIEEEDPAVRAGVESLLASFDDGATSAELFPLPDSSKAAQARTTADPVGKQIGSYRLIERLAVGGMSTVYLAEPIDKQSPRRVAIKIITATGPLTQRAQRRFRHERQLLGKLDHTNIAKLLHGGVTDDGWPYLVMEYVEGKPIDEYCEAHNLPIERRIEVFRGVCAAVQYAHQNLVVHRDLKPSNILVNNNGVPKLLDFGIAKLLQSDDDVRRTATPTTEPFMTPEYASPEQIRGAQVTTASDVYSLGVVLYQLLTGRRPHNFKTKLVYEIARIICDEDPLTPSIAVSQAKDSGDHANSNGQATLSHERPPPTAARRKQLGACLAGDMDAIVMRAIRKEPGARYSSVDQLTDDLARYLHGLPVRARKGSWRYRALKFVQRNRAGVGAIAAIFLVLIAGAATSTWFAFQARKEARAATQARDEANRQAELAQAVNDFLNDDFLAAIEPARQGKDVSMRAVVDAASESIAGKFENAPLIEASVRTTLGNVYLRLGEYDIAAPHLERALALKRRELGDDHSETFSSMSYLAELYFRQGRFDEAERLFVEALDATRRVLGEDDPETIASMTNLAYAYVSQGRYDEAEALQIKALKAIRRKLGEDHQRTLSAMGNLAILYKNQGRYDEAEPLYVKTVEGCRRVFGEEHPNTLGAMGNLADLYDDQGRYDEAESLLAAVLEAKRRVLGEEHPGTLASMNNLAALYYKQGRYDEAEPLFLTALEAKLRVLGEDHPDTAIAMSNLAQIYIHQGRYDEAEPLNIRAFQLNLERLGEDHPGTLLSMNNLGALYHKQGRYDEAEELYVATLQRRRRVLGDDHPHTLFSMDNLAVLYTCQGRYDAAAQLFDKALEAARRVLGSEHPTTLRIMSDLGRLYTSEGRYEEAEPLYDTALEAQRRVLGDEQLGTLSTMSYLIRLYVKQARYDEAEQLCGSALDAFRRGLGVDHPTALEIRGNLAMILGCKGEIERAEQMFHRVIELQVAKLGPDHPNVMTTKNDLAELLRR